MNCTWPGNILGISMGSSEGGGYANKDGNLPGWINEMCYYKLDMNPKAYTDPWTKGEHRGISHMYLGQRGATKLAPQVLDETELKPNLRYPHDDMCTMKHVHHADALVAIQKAMADPAKTAKVSQLYETVGVYLGYGLAQVRSQDPPPRDALPCLPRLAVTPFISLPKSCLPQHYPQLAQC